MGSDRISENSHQFTQNLRSMRFPRFVGAGIRSNAIIGDAELNDQQDSIFCYILMFNKLEDLEEEDRTITLSIVQPN